MAKDYYKILGVDKNASDEELKKAYRKLAHQHHPDKASGDEAKFKEVNEAYQVLSNKEKRANYDRFGTADFNGFNPGQAGGWGGAGGFPGGFGFNGFDGNVDMGDLGDFVESIFGGMGGARRRGTPRGADLETTIEITLEEVLRGVKKTLDIRTFIQCDVCKGDGGEPGAGSETCPTCKGAGQVREERRTFLGNFAQVRTCDRCHGKGSVPKKLCVKCKGKGRVHGERKTVLEIMPGIEDTQVIQVKGFGEAGEYGVPAGDLYVRIRVKSHQAFARRGDDLIVRQNLEVMDLLLGKKLSVPTLEGERQEFEIAAGFDLKQPYRIPNKGLPHFGSHRRGDLLVDFIIKAPKKLSPEQRKGLESDG